MMYSKLGVVVFCLYFYSLWTATPVESTKILGVQEFPVGCQLTILKDLFLKEVCSRKDNVPVCAVTNFIHTSSPPEFLGKLTLFCYISHCGLLPKYLDETLMNEICWYTFSMFHEYAIS